MTSTGINQGLGDDSRNSSKVLRPPGGGSSISFGGEPDPAPQRQSQKGHVQPTTTSHKSKPLFGESDHVEKILPQARGSDSKNRIFGGSEDAENVAPRRFSSSSSYSNIFGEGDDGQNDKQKSDSLEDFIISHHEALRRERIDRLRRGHYNPITGEKYDKTAAYVAPPKPQPTANYKPLPSAADGPGVMQSTAGKSQDVKTSSRVLNPPGGPTTKLW